MYSIEFSKAANKTLATMPKDLRALILTKLVALATDPHGTQHQARRLAGRPEYRLRVHDWRVIYRLVEDRVVLLVIKIGSRGHVYE